MRKLTYPSTGLTMEVDGRPLRRYWRQTSFQKDNGHTESLASVRRTIATSNGRATSQGGVDESATLAFDAVPSMKFTAYFGPKSGAQDWPHRFHGGNSYEETLRRRHFLREHHHVARAWRGHRTYNATLSSSRVRKSLRMRRREGRRHFLPGYDGALDSRASDRLLHMDEVDQGNLDAYLSLRGRWRRKFLQASGFMGGLTAVGPGFAQLRRS